MATLSASRAWVTTTAVAIGGASGTGLRLAAGLTLPAGISTLVVNVLGCLLLGYVTRRVRSSPGRGLLGTGLAGALTTFSTFAVEALDLVVNRPVLGVIYAVSSVVLGALAARAGLLLGQWDGHRQLRT